MTLAPASATPAVTHVRTAAGTRCDLRGTGTVLDVGSRPAARRRPSGWARRCRVDEISAGPAATAGVPSTRTIKSATDRVKLVAGSVGPGR
ncbi:MAG: hypothetical protein QOF88_3743 [Mycobacterium sp.]|jgi:hypothetical protein|nr:hypothetical protein [Mycobacterium sp.]